MIVEHAGLAVSDLARAIAFYTEVLGFRLLRRTPTNAYLHLGDELLELMQAAPGASPVPGRGRDTLDRMVATVGLNHIGFRVDDLDAVLESIEQRGGTVVTPPFEYTPEIEFVAETASEKLERAARPRGRSTWRIAVVEDPDGTMLEVLER